MCKTEGTRCESLTAAQRKDAGHPADADGQAQPAPGGEAADADPQKNSTAPASEHSDYYMCKTEGKQCDTLTAEQRKDAGHPGEPSPNHSAYFMCKHFREQCDALTPAQRKDAGLPS